MKIFSDPAYLPPNVDHIWQLSPFWGLTELEARSMQPKRLSRYLQESSSIFEMTSLNEADFAIFPAEYQLCDNEERRVLFDEFKTKASQAGKPTVVFTGGDLEHELPGFHGYEFHTSLYRSGKSKNAFAMPPAIGDIVEEELAGSVTLLPKPSFPTLSFCGFAPPFSTSWGKERLKEIVRDVMYAAGLLSTAHIGYAPRAKAIRALRKSKIIGTDFFLRENSPFMWAFGYLLQEKTEGNFGHHRREYLDNLLGSAYALCVRGRGNYSLRFYEALCCARIPVFINTDCVLPLEDRIPWKEYCVWIEESDISHIDDILADFHARISNTRFSELQLACRKLWLDYLSPEGFMRHLSSSLVSGGLA
jgi:Exostosin family